MDPGSIALLIPVVAILSGAAVKIAKVRQGAGGSASPSQDTARLESLEDEVSQLRQELSEAQERIDFAERMLAKGRDEKHLDGTG
ncbi:MAG: hypothetical protein ABI679_06435 [Gemmatimonadota bacterium]